VGLGDNEAEAFQAYVPHYMSPNVKWSDERDNWTSIRTILSKHAVAASVAAEALQYSKTYRCELEVAIDDMDWEVPDEVREAAIKIAEVHFDDQIL